MSELDESADLQPEDAALETPLALSNEPTTAPDRESGEPPAKDESARPKHPRRLASLDAFRGLTILGMLLVNNIALDTATPKHLTHAAWNRGVTFADMVFPWFVLIVGVAIPFAAASRRRKGVPLWQYDLKILGRAASLVLIGCLIDSSVVRQPVFSLGVLQLIGMAYFVAALLYELPLSRRLIVAGALLVGHWAAIRFLPIPGVGVGVFTESTNIINHLNQTYLEPYHLRGLISAIPTSALALIGTGAGDIIRDESQQPMQRVARLLVGGSAMVAVGWLWSLDIPFNKPVWTSSYILYAAGWGTLVLGLFYLVIDVNGWRVWAFPLIVPGMNAIFIYVVPILTKLYILQPWTVKIEDGSHLMLGVAFMHYFFSHFGRIPGGWLYTLAYILFWWLVVFWMYRKKAFWRV